MLSYHQLTSFDDLQSCTSNLNLRPEKIRQVVPIHVEYWKAANLKGYMGGPSADRTGGLISFVASSLEEATNIILQDPFILEDLIAEKWIKEWIVE